MKTLEVIPRFGRCARMSGLMLLALVGATQAQPALQSVSPANGATQVAVTTPVVFTFDAAMSGMLPFEMPPFLRSYIQWSANVSHSDFEYAWNDPLTVLTCTPLGNLPGDAVITWTLNPPEATMPLTDENYENLPMTSGSFTTGAGGGPACDPDGIPDAFGNCSISKFLVYEQTGPAAPALSTNEPPMFMAFANSPEVNPVTAASLRLPNASTRTLSGFMGHHYWNEEFASQAALDGAYPGGSYEMTMSRQTPPATVVTMTMPAPTGYPPVPQLANYAAAQAINPAQPFTLQWNAYTGATGMDGISLTIQDQDYNIILSAPDLCVPVPLPNTATSVVLPSGLLQSNQTYTAQLVFSRLFHFSTNSPANFATVGSLMRQTTFPLKTLGSSSGARPRFDRTSVQMTGGKCRFTLNDVLPGKTYLLEYSLTFQPASWTLLLTTNASASVITYTDPGSGSGHRFYRARTD